MKKIIILSFFIVSSISAMSEKYISLSQLEGTWQRIEDVYKLDTQIWKISKSMITIENKRVYSSNVEIFSQNIPYFLSVGIPQTYDSSSVGHINNGTHIIYYAPQRKLVRNYEIIKLNKNTLVLGYFTPRTIGRKAGTVTLTLKRVSR